MDQGERDGRALAEFLRLYEDIVVLTGAGVSVASGIPTYRDAGGAWRHSAPIQERDFLQEETTRRRYWARSRHGWPVIRDAQPNEAHRALTGLERLGLLRLLITQNVDRLHQRAGSRRVIDLHGRVDRVRCLGCARKLDRQRVQPLLETNWPHDPGLAAGTTRPDGDMAIEPGLSQEPLPHCTACAGALMPDVVFFGGSVPRRRVSACRDAVDQARALLVIGSSLTVYSGFRFCRQAARQDKPIAILNPGVTRADDIAQLRLYSPAGPALQRALQLLSPACAPGNPS